MKKLVGFPIHDDRATEVASQLALDRPAEAERFFDLREERGLDITTHSSAMQLCRRLARTDPARARKIAASLDAPGERACAWAFVAYGLSDRDKPAVVEALDRAIAAIDEVRRLGPGLEPITILSGVREIVPTNPAATILPIVERIAPERLADVFWRAADLCTRFDIDHEDEFPRSAIGFECMLMARYDRQATAILFAPMDAYLRSIVAEKRRDATYTPSHFLAEACLDPRTAVAMIEALAPARSFARAEPANAARLTVFEVLGQPPDQRWKHLWHKIEAHLPLDD